MNVKHLVAASAAAALLAGAAYAQDQRGETPNQPVPASPTDSRTGLPSVDSTRPTGADAGATNLPQGKVDGDASASASGSVETGTSASGAASADAAASTSATATSATSLGASASATTQMVTNGPVPDTPENRAKYGQPLSRAGKMTKAAGN